LRESQLSLVREIASIESQREQSLNKQNLTAQQRKIIDDEYQASVDAAYEKHLQNGKRINAEREREIRLIGVQIEAARKTEAFDIQRIRLEERRFTMSDFAYKVSLEELNVRQRIADLEQQIIDAQNRMGAGKVFEAEKERITDLIEAEKKLSEFRMHSVAMEEYRRRSFREGWSTAMNNYMEESTNAARVAGSMFSSVIGNMESALDKFARTGKLKFSDLAKSIIQDIIAIHLKAQASKVFSMIAQSVGFGFSGTAVGQSQFSLAYGLPSSSGLGLSARANGGDISSGQPYLVGERGPELVVPRNSGTVIPNHALAGAMGGQVINYNGPIIQNMNAIDTQSGIAFLSKNKQAVWAANQSAQRSLPVSR
jgi:lambda family phage tail tape measure protein